MQIENSNPSVLFVEPCDSSALRFGRLFSKVALHWNQIRVCDGAAAIHHMVLREFPDLLITVLDTPKICALDIAEWLKYVKGSKEVLMLVLDPSLSEKDQGMLAQLGVREFLSPAASDDVIQKALKRHVSRIETSTRLPLGQM